MVEIDGSLGEGGGQVLRTALSLSCALRRPFRIRNIRKGRRKPGLMPQHLTCVRAASKVSGARVEGDRTGSIELSFTPERVLNGDYGFDIGTAGSTSLVFQTLLLPLLFAGGPSTVCLKGGTHVPLSPPFDYVRDVFSPLLERLGVRIRAEISRYGFYPKGGGEVRYFIEPCDVIRNADFTERGRVLEVTGVSAVGNLDPGIAKRQRDAALRAMPGIEANVETASVDTPGQGTYLFLRVRSEGALAGFSAIGARGKPAEKVGEEAARGLVEYIESGACLDGHMADQISLYLAFADGESRLRAPRVTGHLETNLIVIGSFAGVDYGVGPEGAVSILGAGRP